MYLDVSTTAQLLGITERAVQWNASQGFYGEVRYVPGVSRGGRVLEIPLAGLPEVARVRYLRTVKPAESVVAPDGWDLIPANRRRPAEVRLQMLEDWFAYREAHKGEAQVLALARKFVELYAGRYPEAKIRSRSALCRWEDRYRKEGRRGLVDWRGAGPEKPSIPDELWRHFLGAYLTESKFSAKDCYHYVRGLAKMEGLSIPSYDTFKRRLKEVPEGAIKMFRHGVKTWERECAPYVTRNRGAVPVGAVWEADHFQLNMLVRTPAGKLCRPFATVFRDFRSGRYVGWSVGEVPSQYTVLAAFEMAAGDPDIGVPDESIMDNGREFTTYGFAGRGHRKGRHKLQLDEAHIKTLFAHLGVVPVFSLPENPTSKGGIERSFVVAETFSKYWDSYVGNRPENRPERAGDVDKHPERAPDFVTVVQAFGEFVRDVLNLRPSDAPHMKGLSPMQAWEQFKHERPVRRVPAEALRLLCMPTHEPYTVQKGGIKLAALGGMRYWSEELHEHLGRKVQVRYRQHDLSVVYCFDPQSDRYLCEAQAQEAIAHGATAEQIRRLHKKRGAVRKMAREYKRLNAELVTGADIFAGHKAAFADNQPAKADRKVVQMAPVSPEILKGAQRITDAVKKEAQRGGFDEAAFKDMVTQMLQQAEQLARQQAETRQPLRLVKGD